MTAEVVLARCPLLPLQAAFDGPLDPRANERGVQEAQWSLVGQFAELLRESDDFSVAVRGEYGRFVADAERWLDTRAIAPKKLRETADFARRLIVRAAFRATPNGLFSAVVKVHLSDDGPDDLDLDPAVAYQLSNNLVADDGPDGPSRRVFTQTPLLYEWGDRARFWQLTYSDPPVLARKSLSVTVPLQRLFACLSPAATEGEIVAALTAAPLSLREETARGFLSACIDAGLVEHIAHPAVSTTTVRPEPRTDRFVDSFRTARWRGDSVALGRIARDVELLLGLRGCFAAVPAVAPPSRSRFRGSLLELLQIDQDDEATGTSTPRVAWWPAADRWNSALDVAKEIVSCTEGIVDITDVVERSAPALPLPWPTDLLVRPVREHGGNMTFVLSSAAPAGVLDARFHPTLTSLGGETAQRYRRFLRAIENELGVRFVEVVIRPTTKRAANAARRPLYTQWWTGERWLEPYTAGGVEADCRYVSLAEITVDVDHSGVELRDADGCPVLLTNHATRRATPPWRRLIELSGSSLVTPLTALRSGVGGLFATDGVPRSAPRITLGTLVLTPRQWWLPTSTCARMDVGELERLLRSMRVPPRYVLRSERGIEACVRERGDSLDLVLRRARSVNGKGLLLEEVLPDVDRTVFHSEAGRHAGELLLRLPSPVDSREVVARAAAYLTARHRALQ